MRQIEGVSFEMYSLGLIHRAVAHGDQNARAGLQRYLSEMLLGWLHEHPSREVACRSESEEHFVTLAFERFWQATLQRQVVYKTLTEVLICLRASLNGAILETLRTCSHPREALRSGPGEPPMQDAPRSRETWDTLQTLQLDQREQRLAYLLYHCGLKPREIVRCCPQEWRDIQEISYLRRIILERLLRHVNQLS